MPAIAPPPPPPTPAHVWNSPSIPWADDQLAQGAEGQKLFEVKEEVCRHWNERAEAIIAGYEVSGDFSYVSVPPNRTFCVKTRYVYVGKGMPRPFDLGDE